MNQYIFYTPEGLCQAPDNSDVENFQVLGFSYGRNSAEALTSLLKDNAWIVEKNYCPNVILHKVIQR